MFHKLRFNYLHRIMSNEIFIRNFKNSCSRRVAAASRRETSQLEAIKIEELKFLHTPHVQSSQPHLDVLHRSPRFYWPIERHFQTDMHLLHHQ